MAKQKVDLIDDIQDEPPMRTAPASAIDLLAPAPPPAAPKPAPVPTPHPSPAGYLVKHPSYGALRVTAQQADSREKAAEVYRQTRCPFLTLDALERSGLRIGVCEFRPAATEVGK